jgi:Ca2+-binding EF-hand superfamily protein
MDTDHNGRISIEEFLGAYAEGEIRLKERLNEIIRAMAEHKRQREEFSRLFNESKVSFYE